MWKGYIFFFTLSHGQSSVERGFKVNKDSLKDNLDFSTLKALCVCFDGLIAQGSNIKSFEITKDLIHFCKLALRRYREDLEKKKESDQEI